MRSCGGAVQGIRELSLSVASQSQDTNGETIYLNRADGGFVYIDDGSYSFGPEKWNLLTDDEVIVMTNLAFTASQRGWLTAKLRSENGMLPQSTMTELFRPILSVTENLAVDNVNKQDNAVPAIKWERMQRVRMPNPTQPWSLARAKWEQQLLSDETSNVDKPTGTGSLMGWSFVETISKENQLFADILGSENSFNVNCLAICEESAVARSSTRCYDSTGLLKGVAFLEGRIKELD